MQSIQQLKQNLFVCVFHLLTNWKKAHSCSYTTHMVENKASSHLGMTCARSPVGQLWCDMFLFSSRSDVSGLQKSCFHTSVFVCLSSYWWPLKLFLSAAAWDTRCCPSDSSNAARCFLWPSACPGYHWNTHLSVTILYTFMILFKTKQRCQTAS